MASKLNLMNENGKVLSVSSGSILEDKVLEPGDFKYIRDTISSLGSISSPLDGDVCFVKGYHSSDDSSGGTFIYRANTAKTEHNGGTFIDPNKTFPSDWNDNTQLDSWFTGDGNGNGIWERIYTRAVDIKWFGAKEDGITDDSKSIAKALSITVKNSSNSNQYLIIQQLLEEIKKIDGSGSGIDADLLDGIDSTSFSQKAEDEIIDGSKEWSSDTLKMTNLPTSDPGVDGQLWNNNGIPVLSGISNFSGKFQDNDGNEVTVVNGIITDATDDGN